MKAQPGLLSLMHYLDSKSISKASKPSPLLVDAIAVSLPIFFPDGLVLTRNFETPTQHLISTHLSTLTSPFHPILTRTFKPPKPHPAGIHHIASEWGCKEEQMIMVGDSLDDMRAGRGAGVGATVLLLAKEGHNASLVGGQYADVAINRYAAGVCLIPRPFLTCSLHRLDDLISLLDEGKLPIVGGST